MLTIVIPVKEQRGITEAFLENNEVIFAKYPTIVVDSGGGESLREYSDVYIKKDVPLCEARKLGYSMVKTPFILNLDVDVIVPEGYIERGIPILQQPKIGAVSIFFKDEEIGLRPHWGVLQYGISIWKTGLLNRFYDYHMSNDCCECLYMWRKLEQNGFRLETLPYRANHLKNVVESLFLNYNYSLF